MDRGACLEDGACLEPWVEGGARVPRVARVDRGTYETAVRGWPV